jgi:hypothetical protein
VTTKEQQQSKLERAGRANCTGGSPTGAHHWVLGSPSATMKGECKYCHAERAFTPFEDEVGFNNSPKKKRAAAAATAASTKKVTPAPAEAPAPTPEPASEPEA